MKMPRRAPFGRAQPLQGQDEADRRDEIAEVDDGGAHQCAPRAAPARSPEHLQHAVGDHEAADHVDGRAGDGDAAEDRAELIEITARGDQRADQRDAGDGVGAGHERRVQQVRHLGDDLVAEKTASTKM